MQNTLLHIGFHKTGSTFLQEYFQHHPSVYFTREYNSKVENNSTQNLVVSNMRITIGEDLYHSTNLTLKHLDFQKYNREKAYKLKQLYPTAKVLITIRSFESMLPSLYSQYLINGGRFSFQHFIENDAIHLKDLFNYDQVYLIYAEFFSKENILILPYEQMKKDVVEYLEIIESFLNLPHFDFNRTKINESVSPSLHVSIQKWNNRLYYLSRLLPQKIKQLAYKKYVNYLLKNKDELNNRYRFDSISSFNPCVSTELIQAFKTKSTLIKNEKHVIPYAIHY